MSEWLQVDKADITQNIHKDEIHIWFESDDSGNRYISIEGEALVRLREIINTPPLA